MSRYNSVPNQITQQPWTVYILRCSDGSLYTGITTDIERRFVEHQQGSKQAKSLRGKTVESIVFTLEVSSRNEALKIEAYIKRLPKARKELLVAGDEAMEGMLFEGMTSEA